MVRYTFARIALALLATIYGASVFAAAEQARGAHAVPLGTRDCLGSVICDPALGVLLALPAGWSVAPHGQYAPGSLDFVSGGDRNVRLAIEPLGIAGPLYPAAAAIAGADALTQGLTVSVGRSPWTVGGAPAVMLLGMPGASASVQIVVAHAGALYDLVAFGAADLLPDVRQALAGLRFIPRSGPFPPAGTPQPLIAALRDPCRDLASQAPVMSSPTGGTVRLHLAFTISHAQGNDMVGVILTGMGLPRGRTVRLVACWNRGRLPTYTWYQLLGPMRTSGAGTLGTRFALYVPSGSFAAWTVRALAVDAQQGRLLGVVTRSGHAARAFTHGMRLQPHSAHVMPGRAYPFRLYTHCGVDFAVDFDGSFWDLAEAAWSGGDGNPPPGIGNPFQDGTMTLVDARHARFDFSGGRIDFTRHRGAKIVPGLCS